MLNGDASPADGPRLGGASMPLLIDTRQVLAADRFSFWLEECATVFCPLAADPTCTRQFSGLVWGTQLGIVRAFYLAGDPVTVKRTETGIGAFDPEWFEIAVPIAGAVNIAQGWNSNRAMPGDIFTYDTSRPFTFQTTEYSRFLMFCFPKALMGPDAGRFCETTAVPFRSGDRVGELIRNFLIGAVRGVEGSPLHGAEVLGRMIVDLVSGLHGGRVASSAPPRREATAHLVDQLKAFVDRNLADPALDARRIAQQHHVSERYVYRLFEREGCSLGEWIRSRRLERCRQDLANPHQAHLTIGAIASRWGVSTPGHFSRMFRDSYGLAPRDYRARFALRPPANGQQASG